MGRLIAAGDEHQAIYGWRGAHANSMDVLGERFNCLDLPLSITYRCPVAVVEHARQWVPELEARPATCECGHPKDDHIGGFCIHDTCGTYLETDPGAPWGVVLGEDTDWTGQAEISLMNGGCDDDDDRNGSYDYESHECGWAQDTQQLPARGGCSPLQGQAQDSTSRPTGDSGGISKWRGHLTDFLPGDAILCRVNRPLVSVAFALIRAKVSARVLGRDIGQGLAVLAKKLAKDIYILDNSKDEYATCFSDHLAKYRDKQISKLRRRGKLAEAAALDDRLDTLQVFVDEMGEEDGLQELLGSITRLFGEAGEVRASVILSTVHKAKGMEWDRVFILDASELMPSPWARKDWEAQQERHIAYVACTRAKRELRYIKSDNLIHGGSQ